MQAQNVTYSWPDLSRVRRQYVVVDDQGRYGIAHATEAETIWAKPIGTPARMTANPDMGLPTGAILLTSSSFNLQPDGTYKGTWSDYSGPSHVPESLMRHLSIVDDLGYVMPDRWADVALAGSDEMGHWNYGATLGKVGGKTPVNGQRPGEMTVGEAESYAVEVGETVTARAIRHAAASGYIPDSRKVGRDWLITYEGMNHYLDNRPKRGRKTTK